MIVVAPTLLRAIGRLFRIPFPVKGLALFFCIVVADEESKNNKAIINHERIHLKQQQETLFIGFTVIYLWEMIRNGYHNIRFEKEAYHNMTNLNYLETRLCFAWKKY